MEYQGVECPCPLYRVMMWGSTNCIQLRPRQPEIDTCLPAILNIGNRPYQGWTTIYIYFCLFWVPGPSNTWKLWAPFFVLQWLRRPVKHWDILTSNRHMHAAYMYNVLHTMYVDIQFHRYRLDTHTYTSTYMHDVHDAFSFATQASPAACSGRSAEGRRRHHQWKHWEVLGSQRGGFDIWKSWKYRNSLGIQIMTSWKCLMEKIWRVVE